MQAHMSMNYCKVLFVGIPNVMTQSEMTVAELKLQNNFVRAEASLRDITRSQ